MIRVTISLPKIRVAVFIPACDKPSFTEIDVDHKTLQALVGGTVEFVDLNEYGISTWLKTVQRGRGR